MRLRSGGSGWHLFCCCIRGIAQPPEGRIIIFMGYCRVGVRRPHCPGFNHPLRDFEVRNLLRRIVDPTWDPYEPKVNPDLSALDKAINGFGNDMHINLRLVRTQLSGLQRTDIHLPVQLLTLIDRSLAKGVHSW